METDVGAQNQCLGSHIFNFQLKCRWVLLLCETVLYEMVLCEMVLCETVLCEMVLCET